MPEQHLIFAVLAVHHELISAAELLVIFSDWLEDKSYSLTERVVRQSTMSVADRELIEQLVAQRQSRGNGEIGLALANFTDAHSLRAAMTKLSRGDAETSKAVERLLSPPLQTVSELRTCVERSSAVKVERQFGAGANRFRIVREHARGGLGVVFVAEDLELKREVALKQIRPDKTGSTAYRAKFSQEASVTGQLEHPGIVPVYTYGTDDQGQPFYAMRLVHGEDLQSRIKQFHSDQTAQQRRFDGPELRGLLRHFVDVCNAIDYAHDRGVLHRDLKPSNIMLGKHGETLVVDWGLAKPLGVYPKSMSEQGAESSREPLVQSDYSDDSRTQYGSFVGTAAYASPEQLRGELDALSPASDVYSLGAILYHLLTGKPPTSGQGHRALARAFVEGRAIELSFGREVPPALRAICLKAMSPSPADRYQSALALRSDIELWFDDAPVSVYTEPLFRRAVRWMRQHPKTIAGLFSGILIAAVSAGLGSWFVNQKNVELISAQRAIEQALRKSLISEAGLQLKQKDEVGWSWQGIENLQQAAAWIPSAAEAATMRSHWLDCEIGLDARLTHTIPGLCWYKFCFSPDGKLLAAGELKDDIVVDVRVYDTSTWEPVKNLSIVDRPLERVSRFFQGKKPQEGTNTLQFSPDGRWLLAGTRQGRMVAWDASDGFESQHDWNAYESGAVRGAVFTSDSSKIVAISDLKQNYELRVWELGANQWRRIDSPFPTSWASQLWAEHQGRIALEVDGIAHWFDRLTLEPTAPHFPSDKLYQTVGHSGMTMASVSGTHEIAIDAPWTGGRNLLTGPALERFAERSIESLGFSSNDRILAIRGSARFAMLLRAQAGKLTHIDIPIPSRDGTPLYEFSPTELKLVSAATERLEVYEVRPMPDYFQRLVADGCNQVHDVCFDAERLWTLASTNQAEETVYQLRGYDRQSYELRRVVSIRTAVAPFGRARFLPTIALQIHIPNVAWLELSPDSGLTPLPAQTGTTVDLKLRTLPAPALQPHLLVTSQQAADNLLVNALQDAFELGTNESGSALFALSTKSHPLLGERMQCLRAEPFEVIGRWDNGFEDDLTGNAVILCTTPSGNNLLCGCADGFVRVFAPDGELVDRKLLTRVKVFSADTLDGRVALGMMDGEVAVGQADGLEMQLRWTAHDQPVTSIVLLADDLCATASDTGDVKLWKIGGEQAELVLSLPNERSQVVAMKSDSSGRHLAISLKDTNIVQVWSIDQIQQKFDALQLDWK